MDLGFVLVHGAHSYKRALLLNECSFAALCFGLVCCVVTVLNARLIPLAYLFLRPPPPSHHTTHRTDRARYGEPNLPVRACGAACAECCQRRVRFESLFGFDIES